MSKRVKVVSSAGTVMLALLALAVFGMKRAPQPRPEPTPSATHTSQAPTPPKPAVVAETYTWRSYTTKDGLPSEKVLAVLVDGPRVWMGTAYGLAVLQDGKIRTYTTKDGLVHNSIVSLALDRNTGDLWIGTAGGLSRFSAGRFETFNQFNSGLANDMIYGVFVDGSDVWATTASGVSRLNQRTGQWMTWNETNAPMHEPWTYAVAADGNLVYVGAWGAGVLEYHKDNAHWKEYTDPDGEMEIDLFPDDGPVHDITSSLDYEGGIVWQATYFGLGVFDGTRWKGYFTENSCLAGNFINFTNANGRIGWMGTENGLSAFDGKTWHTFRRLPSGQGETTVCGEHGENRRRVVSPTGPVHSYVHGIDFDGDKVWIATEAGVSVGTPESGLVTVR